jgi:hypothetical protein
MRSIEEFNQFYDSQLTAKIEKVDQLRNPARKANKAGFGLGCGIFLTFIVAVLAGGFNILVVIVGGFTLYSGYRWYKLKDIVKVYQSEFKKEIIHPIVKFISTDLNYSPERYVNQNTFRSSLIFREKADEYGGDDLISGSYSGHPVQFSEILVEKKGEKSKTTIFQGLFFITEFNKDFDGHVILLPKSKIIKGMKSASAYNRTEEKIKLENRQIMEQFDCFSNNDILARYVLSFSLMEKIAKFSELYPDNPIYLSFAHGKMYLAVRHYKPLFEPSIGRKVDYKALLKDYFLEIVLILSIIEELDMDIKIWSKE